MWTVPYKPLTKMPLHPGEQNTKRRYERDYLDVMPRIIRQHKSYLHNSMSSLPRWAYSVPIGTVGNNEV